MHNSAIKRKGSLGKIGVGGLTLSCSLIVLLLGPQSALAAASDVPFQQYVTDICFGVTTPPSGVVWDTAAMCTNASSGFFGSGQSVSPNLGTANAGNNAVSRRNKVFREQLDEEKDKPKKKGASADGGKWGLLVAPQYGKSNRIETDLENGFDSDLKGLALGLDFRSSDTLVFGAMLGRVRDEAAFLNGAGSLDTQSNTLSLYGTWLHSESVAVDGYMGYGKIELDSARRVVFGTAINGTAIGNTKGQQILAGFSASYQQDFGSVNLSPFFGIDAIETRFDGYNETGTTTLELHFGDRKTRSVTSSVGVRATTSHGFEWGSLSPSLRFAAVHEFQNNATQINNELVITPGAGFLVTTDEPDRNYVNAGLGIAAGLNSGMQLFLNYEKRIGDKLLDTWAVSGGLLMEF
jgi:outer membrane autotransporter protein